MIAFMGVWKWWARQGLNLRPHPCEGSFRMQSGGNALFEFGTDGDSSANITAFSDHNLTTLSTHPVTNAGRG